MGIIFEAKLIKIGSRKVVRIPLSSSREMPSRGMVMIRGTMNDVQIQEPLEPDGEGSHWFEVSDSLFTEAGLAIGQNIYFNIEPINEWKEPEMQEDIMDAIISAGLLGKWNAVSVKAKWEWLRWIRSTGNPQTRKKRIQVACSKLLKGDKRPCCFDGTRCTIPDVSKSGVLLSDKFE